MMKSNPIVTAKAPIKMVISFAFGKDMYAIEIPKIDERTPVSKIKGHPRISFFRETEARILRMPKHNIQ